MSWKDNFPKENRYFETENGILYKGEAIEIMSKFPDEVFDAIITDPPYGTTLVACEKLNRRWIGVELEEKYCEITKQRILNAK